MTEARPMKIRLLSEKDIRAIAPTLPETVALVEQAYSLDAEGKAEVPTKIGVHPDRANTFLHAMPAWVGDARALGIKWISYFPGNFARGLPDSSGIIILNDPEHGLPCCIMEGMYVTFLRTAACAAVAAKYLVPRPPKTLGLIGCGGLGLWSLRLMSATFPSIDQVFVSSRTPGSRERFCAKMAQEGTWAITPVDDPLAAVRNIDIVVTSMPPGPVQPVAGEAFKPGTLFIPLDLVNSFSAQVEAKRATGFPALKKSVRIQDIVVGKGLRASASDRSVVAVCGIASTDVVVGWDIYRRARAARVGLEFDMQG
jgi:alanine dehydrogenase